MTHMAGMARMRRVTAVPRQWRCVSLSHEHGGHNDLLHRLRIRGGELSGDGRSSDGGGGQNSGNNRFDGFGERGNLFNFGKHKHNRACKVESCRHLNNTLKRIPAV